MRGFTYLGLLIAIAIMSVTLAATAVVWHTANQREKEKELLFVGDEFRRAIGAYYEASPANAKQYPRKLEDLVRDPRYVDVRRYLRKVYADPMTGKPEWGLLKGADGGIAGVHSLSAGAPIKRANFPFASLTFSQAKRYSDWKFAAASSAPAAPGSQKPGALAAQGGAGAPSQAAPGGAGVAAPAAVDPAELERRPECVAQLAADRAACAAASVRDGESVRLLCEARIPARVAACMQKRPPPALVVGP